MHFDKAPKSVSMNDAISHVESIRTQIHQMGANDSENNILSSIIKNLSEGKISPSEAMKFADIVRDSKNAYH